MPLLPPNFPANLDPSQPLGTDPRNISDDEHRNAKASLQMTFPNVGGAVTATQAELNVIDGYTGNTADLNSIAGQGAIGGVYMKGVSATTVALFLNSSAPNGWTITTAFDSRMIVTKGTINGLTVAGGDTGGTDDPGINNTVPNHKHFIATDGGTGSGTNLNATNQMQRDRDGQSLEKNYDLGGRSAAANIGLSGDPSPGSATGWVPKFAACIACTLS